MKLAKERFFFYIIIIAQKLKSCDKKKSSL